MRKDSRKRRCVVVGGADISCPDRVAAFLRPDDFVICCDSGLEHMDVLEAPPDLIVGDFDSHADPHLDIETITLPVAKDDTDSVFAVKEGMRRGFKEFLLIGVIGARLDHTLVNVYILTMLENRGCHGVIVDDYSEMELICGYRGGAAPETEAEGCRAGSATAPKTEAEGRRADSANAPETEAECCRADSATAPKTEAEGRHADSATAQETEAEGCHADRATETDPHERCAGTAFIEDRYPFFSLLAVEGPVRGVSIRNAKFPLENAEITADYQYATSNEVLPGKTAEVEVRDGRLLLIKIVANELA